MNKILTVFLRNKEKVLLILLISTILISHFFYVYKTYQFPQWDENVYLQYSVDFLPILKHPTLNFWNDILSITKQRQPFYSLFISIPLLVLGTEATYKTALIVNGFFYAASILLTYLLAREFLSKTSSLIASYIFAFYGFPLFYIHFAYEETVATTFIMGAILFLAKSFKKPSFKKTLFFSLFTSTGMLVRWITPVFIFGSLTVSLVSIIKKYLFKKNKKIKLILPHAGIFFSIIIIPVLFLYYLPNLSIFSDYVKGNYIGGSDWAPEPIKNQFSKSSIIWYANILAQQTIFFWSLFILGFIFAFCCLRKYKFLVVTFIFPYLVLTFCSAWKEDRFIVPLYPIMAIISAITVDTIKNHFLKMGLISLIIIIGFLNFLGASWGIGPMRFSSKGERFVLPNSILLTMPIGHPRRIWLAPISWPPRSDEGNVPLVIRTIKNDFSYENNSKPNIFLTFDFSQISEPLAVKANIENPNLFSLNQLYGITDYNVFFEKLEKANYLLIKTGRIYDEPRKGQKVVRMIQLFHDALIFNNNLPPKAFKPINQIKVPIDNSSLIIYKKTRKLSKEDWDNIVNIFIKVDPISAHEISKSLSDLKLY